MIDCFARDRSTTCIVRAFFLSVNLQLFSGEYNSGSSIQERISQSALSRLTQLMTMKLLRGIIYIFLPQQLFTNSPAVCIAYQALLGIRRFCKPSPPSVRLWRSKRSNLRKHKERNLVPPCLCFSLCSCLFFFFSKNGKDLIWVRRKFFLSFLISFFSLGKLKSSVAGSRAFSRYTIRLGSMLCN